MTVLSAAFAQFIAILSFFPIENDHTLAELVRAQYVTSILTNLISHTEISFIICLAANLISQGGRLLSACSGSVPWHI